MSLQHSSECSNPFNVKMKAGIEFEAAVRPFTFFEILLQPRLGYLFLSSRHLAEMAGE